MTTPTPQRKYFGNAAHFIGSDSCRFHIATQVGEYVVSTVGEYKPASTTARRKRGEFEEIGYNRLYETMVFRITGVCKCGCACPTHSGTEIDTAAYNTPADANAGHEALCEKWAFAGSVSQDGEE